MTLRSPEPDSLMVKRRKWQTFCQGKEAFESRAVANSVRLRRNQKGKPTDVYKCRGCGKYHLGTPT